jgi:uncharacterized protein
MITKEEIIKQIEQEATKLRSLGVMKIELFGSYAVGKQTENSDIDFLVEYSPERGSVDDHLGLLDFLRKLFSSEIDLSEQKYIRKELRDSILGGERIVAKI